MMKLILASIALVLTSCTITPPPAHPQDGFFARLQSLCGKAFAGRVTTTDAVDAQFVGEPLVMHVRQCDTDVVRIPFHVGDDRSRTWVITRTTSGLRLKHDHRHQDGSSDTLTMYGGDTAASGSPTMQSFPADPHSIAMFRAAKLDASVANIWEIEVDDRVFAYGLRRPGRHFRVVFDLTQPVPVPPPPPWGG